MKHTFTLLALLFIFSCTSEHEKNALKELSFMGGEVSITSGNSITTNNENTSYKKITYSKVDLFERDLVEPQLLASKIAITYFLNLDQSKLDFDVIIIELIKSNGVVYDYEISKNKLLLVKKEIDFVNQWISEFSNGNIEKSYDKYFNITSPGNPPRDQYISTMNELLTKFGKTDSLMLNGFGIQVVDDKVISKGEIHEFIYQFFIKSKSVYSIGLYINPADSEFKIYGITLDAD